MLFCLSMGKTSRLAIGVLSDNRRDWRLHAWINDEYTAARDIFYRASGGNFRDVEIVSRRSDRSIHRYTYKECADRARRLATALRGLGLQPGDRVATLMWNHYAHFEAYFGIPLAGGVFHTLNLRLHPAEIARIAAHCRRSFRHRR
jgi:acyl-CoA synthetase (AMP-forming)/AMP-acid ligase II